MSEGIVAGIFGFVGVVVGAGITTWAQHHERRAAELARWRERSAEALAAVSVLLVDADPTRVAVNFSPEETPRRFEELRIAADGTRRELEVIHAGHPSPRVRDLARELSAALNNAMISVGWYVLRMARDEDTPSREERAVQDHRTGQRISDELATAINDARR